MRTLTKERLPEIIEKITKTYTQVMDVANLKSTSHFGHMIRNLLMDLGYVKNGTLSFEKHEEEVRGMLREINDYFIALGTNDAFRSYEFDPSHKTFRLTSEGFVGYTKMMLPRFQ
ncbi:MAG: hypothetical protein WC796_04315 [Candidatus Pacearchaeota archaeon]|jgi:ribosomal protein L30/L7E